MTSTVARKGACASAYARLARGTAIFPLALGMVAFTSPAMAANECGLAPVGGGTVTCIATDNPFSNGISYTAIADDLTVSLENDVAVSASANDTRGIVLSGIGANTVTLTGGTASVSTTGANATAVDVSSLGGPVSITVGNVSTSGSLAGGVRAIGGIDGDVTVVTGNVTTTGLDGSSFFFLPNSTAITATATGTGNVTVDAGSISTAGLGARGVNASAVAGDVTVTTAAVTTTGDNAIAIAANSGTGNVDVMATGAIDTSGDFAHGVYATAMNGAAAVDVTSITTTGFNANGVYAMSGAGGTTVNFDDIAVAGTLTSGIDAQSVGGAVNISGGSVMATGQASTAVYGYSDTGMVNIATTGTVAATGRGGSGIYAASASGDVMVSASNVTTVAADSADTETSRSAIYAQGANANVTLTGTANAAGQALFGGSADAVAVIATDGDAMADVNAIRSTGATSRALSVSATGDATATVRGAVSASGDLADAVFIDAGDKATVNVTSGGTITAADGNLITVNSINGTTINNAGILGAARNGYTLAVTGGPATVNNSGTLNSDITLTAGNDTVNNSGTFVLGDNPNFGAGLDTFNNTGTVVFGQRTAASAKTMVGLERLNNSGLIDMRNGITGDTLTIPGTFTGSGNSQLGVDVNLGTGASDTLIVGGAATGSSSIVLRQTGTQALFNSGVTVVQAGAGSSANAFVLAGANGGVDAGLVRYEIVYNPADASYNLVGGPSDAAYRTLNYVEGVRSLWLKSADVVSAQLQARRDQLWAQGEAGTSGKFWLQMHGSVEDRGNGGNFTAFGATRSVDTSYRQDYFGGQVGFDFGGGSGERGGFAFGVTGGYISSSMNFDNASDRVQFDVVNAGVYGAFTSGNVFINALGKYDYYWATAHGNSGGFRDKSKGDAYGGRVEAGLRFGNDSFFAEPAVSVSYLKTGFDSFASQGVNVDFNDADGLRGRAGARIGTQFDMFGSKASIYAGGNYVHEFKGRDSVTFISGGEILTYRNNRVGDYGEAKLGIEIAQTGGVSGFIEGTYIRSFSDNSATRSDIEGAGGRAGLRIRF